MPNAIAPTVAQINIAKSNKFAITAASPVMCAYGRNVRVPPPVFKFRFTGVPASLIGVNAIVADCPLR